MEIAGSVGILVEAAIGVKMEEYPYVDLRVDEHRDPVSELRRVFEAAKHQLLPFAAAFLTRVNPVGRDKFAAFELVQRPPEQRGT